MRLTFSSRPLPAPALGRAGERRAAWHYRLRGYRILARNLRLASGELDLVVRRGNVIAIVEVKTRQSRTAGEGHDAVDRRKREQLVRLGDQYAARHPGIRLRYDVVSIFWTGRRFVISRYEDAFRSVSDAREPWRWRA
ncbi:MAG TPA: YraN family protein [Thermoanaerobaculia bacterium]|nr:YraN family protein [Thermoanaerobaculia bacterium]